MFILNWGIYSTRSVVGLEIKSLLTYCDDEVEYVGVEGKMSLITKIGKYASI